MIKKYRATKIGSDYVLFKADDEIVRINFADFPLLGITKEDQPKKLNRIHTVWLDYPIKCCTSSEPATINVYLDIQEIEGQLVRAGFTLFYVRGVRVVPSKLASNKTAR